MADPSLEDLLDEIASKVAKEKEELVEEINLLKQDYENLLRVQSEYTRTPKQKEFDALKEEIADLKKKISRLNRTRENERKQAYDKGFREGVASVGK
jgi:polyhydroxyalkanoate synthesis regulator phasin